MSLLTPAATVLRMNMNSVWATEKAAPVSRSGFGIIPANLFYCTTTRKNCVNTKERPLYVFQAAVRGLGVASGQKLEAIIESRTIG